MSWHFNWQLLFVVAKVIYSVSVLFVTRTSRRFTFWHLSDSKTFTSLILLPFLDFFFQRLVFLANRRTSHAAQKPAVLPLTPSSQPALFIKACSARCFFPPNLLEVGFTLANPPISIFIGAPGISLAPFPLSFWRRKAILTVSSFPLSRLILVSPGRLIAFSISPSLMSPGVKASLTARTLIVSFFVSQGWRQARLDLTFPYFPFLFVTIAARHLSRSTCPRSPTSFSTLGQYPTTSTFIGVPGASIAHFSLPFGAIKPPVP